MKLVPFLILMIVAGCTGQSENPSIYWNELDTELENLVFQNEGKYIFILFGSESNKIAMKNKRVLEHSYRRATNHPEKLVFYYGDTRSPDSVANRILKDQGLAAPANLFYFRPTSYRGGEWSVMDDILDKGSYKTLFIWSQR